MTYLCYWIYHKNSHHSIELRDFNRNIVNMFEKIGWNYKLINQKKIWKMMFDSFCFLKHKQTSWSHMFDEYLLRNSMQNIFFLFSKINPWINNIYLFHNTSVSKKISFSYSILIEVLEFFNYTSEQLCSMFSVLTPRPL